MEYGLQQNALGIVDEDPGVFGAAWMLATSVAHARLGIERCFHWGHVRALHSLWMGAHRIVRGVNVRCCAVWRCGYVVVWRVRPRTYWVTCVHRVRSGPRPKAFLGPSHEEPTCTQLCLGTYSC